jgi:copper transport protein
MADVEIVPGRAGPVRVTVRTMTADLAPLPAKEMTVALSNPSAGIEPIERIAEPAEEGAWRVNDLTIPVAGRWKVRIDILISEFEKLILEEVATVRR